MTKTTYRKKSVLGLKVWERGVPQAAEPWHQEAAMVMSPGSWALASSLQAQNRDSTAGVALRPHDFKAHLLQWHTFSWKAVPPKHSQRGSPNYSNLWAYGCNFIQITTLGHFLIFKWYLSSLVHRNRLSAWFPIPSYVLLVFDSLVRGKWHSMYLKSAFLSLCVSDEP